MELTRQWTEQVYHDEPAYLKANFLKEVKFHREHCDIEHCDIQLWALYKLAERAGLTFTAEERML